jgi:imidazole glycerol phosphate synthase glutamine amidotransferase subunit
MEVVIVRTGTANLASVLAGLGRVGATPRVTEDPDDVRHAERVVLPGVGAFGAAMGSLGPLADALVERAHADKPLLCVCLGLQLLCEESEESPGVRGLGIVPARVTRLPDTVRVPQIGWNRVEAQPDCRLLQSGYAYYANSYRVAEPPAGWAVALTDHGGPFVGAMERGALLACQFHPELSGPWGLALLERWLRRGGATC